jgi:hypothetical protein
MALRLITPATKTCRLGPELRLGVPLRCQLVPLQGRITSMMRS